MDVLWYVLVAVVCIAAGGLGGYFYRRNIAEAKTGARKRPFAK